MTRTLLTHPSPSLLRHQTRIHLGQAATLTLVPNLAAGRSLRQLTRQALPTVTFNQLARRELARAGWQPLQAAAREARLQGLLTRLHLEYFGPILDRPGTVAALGDVTRALLRADASRLPPGRSARERDLAQLHRAWVLELLRDTLYDTAVPEFFASRVALSPQVLTVSGFAYLDAAQIALLDRVAADGSVLFLAAAGPGGLTEAQRTAQALRARGWTVTDAPGDPHERDPRLTRPGDRAARAALSGAAGPVPEVPVFALGSVVEETREVLRQVKAAHLDGGVPWHDLAVVVRDEAAYLPPLLESARRYGVPLLSQARQPLLATPLGAFLHAWISAALDAWPFARTAAVLTHPLPVWPADLEAARRRFGRRAPRGLRAWAESGALDMLIWPDQASGEGYLRFLTHSLTDLGVLDRQRQDADLGVALTALEHALAPLGQLPPMSAQAFLPQVQAALTAGSVPVLPGKGGVRVLTPLGTLGRSFRAAWVLGLSEGVFPRPVTDPPLLDAHLRAFWSQGGVYLPGAMESQAVEHALFFHALACARTHLTLTRPEVTAGRRAPPSPYLRRFAPGQAPQEVQAASAQEARVLRARAGDLGDAAVLASAALEDRRERGEDDGPQFPGVVDPDHWTWSASQLHAHGACRYRWFAAKVMRLDSLPEPRRGLDPLGRGSLYHLALQRLLEPHVQGPPPSHDQLVAALPDALDAAADTLTAAGEIDLGPMWAAERRDHVLVLERAVRTPDFLPSGHQIEALEQRLDGHVLVDGHPWTFQGYADRVDVTPAGERIVTDYKLSAYISHVRAADGTLSTEVQLPLYLALSGAGTGRYYSLNQAAELLQTGPAAQLTKVPWTVQQQALTTFLSSVRADIRAGDFRARPDPKAQACIRCDLQPVCRFQSFAAGASA